MPEKSLQEIPRAWRDQYEKGRAAFERNNLDYAIEILSQVAEQEPAFWECRQVLRAAQFKKAGVGGKTLFKKLIGSTNPKLVQAQLALRSNPRQALSLAEEILNHDPNNLSAHKVLADAALALDLPKTATMSLEFAFKHAPKDRDVAMKLAQTLMRTGHGQRAEAILGELSRQHPSDPEITQALKDVAASRTMSEGGYGALASGQGSYRDVLRNEEEAVSLEQEQRGMRTEDATDRLIAEYEARLPREPSNLRLVRSVAELYVQKKEYDKALEYYERLLGTEAADPSLERAISDVRVRQFDQAIEQLDPSADGYAEEMARLKADRQKFLIEDTKQRVDRYPNDLQFRFDYGQLLLEAGRVSEAIQEFQKAQNNPHKRIAALFHLGLCFSRRGMHDLAVRALQTAIREKAVFDDEKKELIYTLGVAFEGMGKGEEAIEQFKLIYEIDIGYRDVAAKVDAYYEAKSKLSTGGS
ncbi:MAG TPA: tetratricopeptide repeat protein [Verrucomicrobiota bacterium]|nr:tetratricopeptide repeat protein [Verrucomicrobiota bacterium]HNU51374.1 tetratricopeptide repeat protein [Verrucomicrobiota bacterium]